MKYTQRVGKIPDGGTPIAKQLVIPRTVSDDQLLTDYLATDEDGFVTLATSGHTAPFYFHLQEVPGGDKFWISNESKATGALSPQEIPNVVRALGDGVVQGVGQEFQQAIISGPTIAVTVSAGTAIVAGHPVVFTANTVVTCARPASGTVNATIVIRLTLTGTNRGRAILLCREAAVGDDAPAPIQTSATWELALYQLAVPNAGGADIVRVWDHAEMFKRVRQSADELRRAAASATSTTGAPIVGLPILNLPLEAGVTYDITARLTANQIAVSPHTDWTRIGSFGPTFGGISIPLNIPGMMSYGPASNWIWVTDWDNDRVFALNAASGGIMTDRQGPGTIQATGVCEDFPTGNVYLGKLEESSAPGRGVLQKWSPGMVNRIAEFHTVPGDRIYGIATDNTFLYVAFSRHSTNFHRLVKLRCSDLVKIWEAGASGLGVGEFLQPYGVAYNPVNHMVYVTDFNLKVLVFNTNGVFQKEFYTGSGVPYGCGVSSDGTGLWIAHSELDLIEEYYTPIDFPGSILNEFTESNPRGIAVAPGDVVWVGSEGGGADSHVTQWDLITSGGGYGGVAVSIGGVVSPYVAYGPRISQVTNVTAGSFQADPTIEIRGYAKATTGLMTMQNLVLSATARPRGNR